MQIKTGTFIYCWWQHCSHYGNQYKGSSRTKIELLDDLAIPFLGTYLKECKTSYNRDTCILTFTAALFTTVKL
jgi:hypothetical protein